MSNAGFVIQKSVTSNLFDGRIERVNVNRSFLSELYKNPESLDQILGAIEIGIFPKTDHSFEPDKEKTLDGRRELVRNLPPYIFTGNVEDGCFYVFDSNVDKYKKILNRTGKAGLNIGKKIQEYVNALENPLDENWIILTRISITARGIPKRSMPDAGLFYLGGQENWMPIRLALITRDFIRRHYR